MVLIVLILLLFNNVLSYSTDSSRPNIIFILGDDWGWSDVGFTGFSDVITPNLDKLANDGLILSKHYAQNLCTPSRAALLTGKYPIHTGMQHDVWNPGVPYGLPLDLTLLPQELKSAGYNTHMFGKWHLGFTSKAYIPNNRGFDTFIGYYNGLEDYFKKTYTYKGFHGYDFRNNSLPMMDNRYSTYFYTEVFKDLLIKESKTNEPFFIYASYQAIHCPNQLPNTNISNSLFKHLKKQIQRRVKVKQAYLFDVELGKIVKLIEQLKIWDNTLIIFESDNGGDVGYYHSNYPLRGNKGTNYEGGHRTPAFINGGYLPNSRKGIISSDLFHITDWYPTLLSLLNIDYDTSDFDGIDQTNMIFYGEKSDRNEILLNLDSYNCNDNNETNYKYCGAIIYNNWKLVMGKYVSGTVTGDSGWTQYLNNKQLTKFNKNNNNNNLITCYSNVTQFTYNENACPWNGKGCLYNLDIDPCEQQNVAHLYPNIYNLLLNKLGNYNKTMKIALPQKYGKDYNIQQANPKLFNGYWTPWLDDETDEKILQDEPNNDNQFIKIWKYLHLSLSVL